MRNRRTSADGDQPRCGGRPSHYKHLPKTRDQWSRDSSRRLLVIQHREAAVDRREVVTAWGVERAGDEGILPLVSHSRLPGSFVLVLVAGNERVREIVVRKILHLVAILQPVDQAGDVRVGPGEQVAGPL